MKQNWLKAEQWKALEMITVVERKSSIATATVVDVKTSARVYENAAAVDAPISCCER